MIIDADAAVDKWMKPGKAQFPIEYRSEEAYESDFVVETKDRILICEIKAEKELADPVVQSKVSAATKCAGRRTSTRRATAGSRGPTCSSQTIRFCQTPPSPACPRNSWLASQERVRSGDA
jgi:type III restriction enzyme